MENVFEIATNYSNLEYDLTTEKEDQGIVILERYYVKL